MDTHLLPRRLGIAAAALIAAALIGLAVRQGWTLAIDARLMDAIRHAGGLTLRQGVADITALGSGTVLLLLLVIAGSLLLAHGNRIGAVRLVAIVLGGRLIVQLIKTVVARARPPSVDEAIMLHSFSFPSSHAANATITYLALAFIATRAESTAPRRLAVMLAGLLALLIGLSRVWLGVHWPSDVVAGWLFGIGWVALAAAVPVGRHRRHQGTPGVR